METEHFNKLTPAEAERLTILAEECGEVIQCVGKILRHGYESVHPDDLEKVPGSDTLYQRKPGAKTNRDRLTEEISDLVAVMHMMEGDVAMINASEHEAAVEKKLRYAHHQT